MHNKKQLIIGVLALLFGVVLLWQAELLPTNPLSKESSAEQEAVVVVKRVIDGDTIELESGERVRLLGIDTPERGKYFFKEASQRMRELVEGKEVTLVKDVSETDKYGRLLRHVYVGDKWINEQMIAEGYARFITIPPDVAHVEAFRAVQKQAFADHVGLWEDNNK